MSSHPGGAWNPGFWWNPLAGDLWPKFCQVIVNLNNIPLGMQTKIIPKTTPRITGEISAPVDHDMFRQVW